MLKKLGMLVLVLALGITGTLYYTWRRALHLPDWYAKQPQTVSAAPESAAPLSFEEQLAEKLAESTENSASSGNNSLSSSTFEPSVSAAPNWAQIPDSQETVNSTESVTVSLNERELNQMLDAAMAENLDNSEYSAAIKGIHTSIDRGRLETGAVVNLSALPVEELGPQERDAIAHLLKTFPALQNRDIYIGVKGKPKIVNGRLQLDRNTKVKLGNLSFTLSDLSNQMGMPLSRLEEKLTQQLQLENFEIETLDLIEDTLVIRGSTP